MRKYICKGEWICTEFFYRSYYQWPEGIFSKARYGLPFLPTQESELKGNCIPALLLSFKSGDSTACRLWGWGTIYMVSEIISSQIFQKAHLKKSARSIDNQNCSYRDTWLFAEVWWRQLAQMKMKGLKMVVYYLNCMLFLSSDGQYIHREHGWTLDSDKIVDWPL